jgi:hypothetical protein
VVTIRDGKDKAADNARDGITERPKSRIGRRRDEKDEVDSQARRKRPRPEDDQDEVVEEYVEEDVVTEEYVEEDEVVDEYVEEEERPKRSKRKRKRKKLYARSVGEEERETPAWVWWVGGLAGIVLTFAILIVIALKAPADSDLKLDAVILIITLPISTVIFFGALIAASLLVGAVEIGEIHIAICKSFGLILAVSLVSLIPFVGDYLTPLVWIPGLMLLFRLDFWETCMVMFFNWVPNFLLRLALMAVTIHWILHGGGPGGGFDRDQPPTKSKRIQEDHIWDEDDIEELGGTVEYDRNAKDPRIVISISFKGVPVGDAEMTHMKDFPHLRRLTLAKTQVTDAGLKPLAECKELIWLDVSDTGVTAAATNELKKSLPNLRIFP